MDVNQSVLSTGQIKNILTYVQVWSVKRLKQTSPEILCICSFVHVHISVLTFLGEVVELHKSEMTDY